MKIKINPFELKLSRPFAISGQRYTSKRTIMIELETDHLVGVGEAALSTFFNENEDDAIRFLKEAEDVLPVDPSHIKETMDKLDELDSGNRAAKCAIDTALYDLVGKMKNKPLYNLLGLTADHSVPCAVTIYIDSPKQMIKVAKSYEDASLFKVKMDESTDLSVLKDIHDETGAKIWIDVNEGWSYDDAQRHCDSLLAYSFIELIEQPLAAASFSELEKLHQKTSIPIYADEDVVTLTDLRRLEGIVDGVNIKIAKNGGIFRSIEMITEARKRNFKVILGSRIESTVATSAASHLIPLVDYVDIDPRELIANDPFDGVYFDGHKIVIPTFPGIGIVPKKFLH